MVHVSGQETATAARSIAGGFVRIEVSGLMRAWRACRSRPLGIGDFRTWLACHEMRARRCTLPTSRGRSPSFAVAELAHLLGGLTERRVRSSLRRLADSGLIVFSPDAIEFPEVATQEVDGGGLDAIGGGRGTVAIPRRILRLLAGGARPALIATTLGILLRCLSRRRAGWDGRGRVKASWVAGTFGVELSRAKVARVELVRLGWIEAEPGDQWAENRWGRAFRIDLEWDRPRLEDRPRPEDGGTVEPLAVSDERDHYPLAPLICARSLPPDLDFDPLQERNQNQEPGEPGGGTGFQIRGTREPIQAPALPAPRLDDIRPEDLRDVGRLLDLHHQAVAKSLVTASENDQLRFVALAEHARSIGKSNPPGLFAALLRRGAWAFITQGEEDGARRNLREHFHGPVRSSERAAVRVSSFVPDHPGAEPTSLGNTLAGLMGRFNLPTITSQIAGFPPTCC